MKKLIVIFVLLLTFALYGCSFGFQWQNSLKPKGENITIQLTDKNNNPIPIIYPVKFTEKEQKAAETLQKYIKEIYDIELPIIEEHKLTGTNFISVGDTKLYEGLRNTFEFNKDGCSILDKNNNLYLQGGKGSGLINAVYTLLEEDLGCRFWDRENRESVPKIKTKKLSFVPRNYNPPFITRDPFNYERLNGEYMEKNKIHGYSSYGFVHTSWMYIPQGWFEMHPDWYGMINGKRKPEQLCWSNPEVINEVEKNLRIYMAATNDDSYHISPMDGVPLCDCPKCNELDEKEGTKAATLIKALNTICERVEKDFPDKKIMTLAYNDYYAPPKTIKPHKNLIIQICSDHADWVYPYLTYDETDYFLSGLKKWISTGCETITWNYTLDFDHFLMPYANYQKVAKDLKILRNCGVTDVFLQGNYLPGIQSDGYMKTWVFSKLMWNPDLNVKDLKKDFIYGYYGKAAKPIMEYENMLDDLYIKNHKNLVVHPKEEYKHSENPLILEGGACWADEELYTKEFVEKSMVLMDKALSLADNEETKKRVLAFRTSVIYLYLGKHLGFLNWENKLTKGDFDPEKKEYYRKLTKELYDTLTDLELTCVAETNPKENVDKYINKFYEIIDNDGSEAK
ncbi:MAG: DUF4838 domain-containing protein [Abditibacteriota bacterium]|nr:DUF4838 domain-containing protein [Abditibacteriota bacterium]